VGAQPEHPQHHAKSRHAACAIVTVSDTRTPESDASGLPDDPGRIRAHLEELFDVPGLDAVLVNGGTGLAPRDTTHEAITGLLEKRLDGFGELFRMLSYQQVGSAAMLSRAAAGVARGKIVVSLPGAPAAVELAMQKLLIPELGHMVHLVRG